MLPIVIFLKYNIHIISQFWKIFLAPTLFHRGGALDLAIWLTDWLGHSERKLPCLFESTSMTTKWHQVFPKWSQMIPKLSQIIPRWSQMTPKVSQMTHPNWYRVGAVDLWSCFYVSLYLYEIWVYVKFFWKNCLPSTWTV